MAITRYAGDRFTIAAGDTKPTGVLDGAVLVDTGNLELYVKRNGSWVEIAGGGGGGTPADPTTSVQFNNGGSFGGDADLTFTDGNRLNVNKLGISGIIYDSNNSIGNGGMVLANEGTTGVHWKNIESVLSGVGGSGVANYVAHWSDEDTLTTGALVDNGTKVGIGTATPTQFLDILATQESDAGIRVTLNCNLDSQAPQLILNRAAQNGGIVDAGDVLGVIKFGGYDGNSVENNTKIEATVNGTPSNNNMPTDLSFYTASAGSPVRAMTINKDQKVGIGTDAPDTLLDLQAAAGADMLLRRAVGDTSSNLGVISFGNADVDKYLAQIKAVQDGATDSARLEFQTEVAGGDKYTRMTIKSDGNVGIGNTAPAYKLDVAGDIRVGQGQSTGILHSGGDLQFYADSAKVIEMWTSGSDYIFKSFHDIAYFSESNIKFGLGTTAPGGILSIGSSNESYFSSTAANTLNFFYNEDGDTGGWINYRGFEDGITQPRDLIIGDGKGAKIATFDGSTKRVGVGTEAPVSSLHVAGDDTISVGPFGGNGTGYLVGTSSPSYTNQPGTSLILKAGDGSGTGSSYMAFYTSPSGSSGTTVNTSVERIRILNDGTLDLKSAKFKINGSGGTNGYTIVTDGSGNISWSSAGTGTVTGSGTDNYVPRWNGTTALQNSSIIALDSGSVGIGTTDPDSALHVYDIGSGEVRFQRVTGYTGLMRFGFPSGTASIRTDGNFQIKASDAWGADLYIKSDGNVGIGTNAPGSLLRVEGSNATAYAGNAAQDDEGVTLSVWNQDETALGSYAALQLVNKGTGSHGKARIACIAPANNQGALAFTVENAGTFIEAMRILGDGKVGINMAIPGYKLDVYEQAGNEIARFAGANSGSVTLRNDAANVFRIYAGASDSLGFSAGNSYNADHLTIASDGNVGIGTTAPAQLLSVEGSKSGAWITKLKNTHATNGNGLLVQAADNNDVKVVEFRNLAETSTFTMMGDGKVGVGSDDPRCILNVSKAYTTGYGVEDCYLMLGGQEAQANSTRLIGFGYIHGTSTHPPANIGFLQDSNDGFTNGDLIFRTRETTTNVSPTERMRILSDGNVGIGDNLVAPEHRLHVSGDAIISGVLYDSTNSSGVAGHVFTSEAGGPQWKMIEDVLSGVGGNGTADYVPRWTDSDTIGDSVISQSGSNIGINMTAANPATELHIGSLAAPAQGGNWASLSIGEDDYPERRTQINAYRSLRGADWDHMGISFQPHTSSSHLDGPTITGMVIDYDGYVGIGNAEPIGTLEVRAATPKLVISNSTYQGSNQDTESQLGFKVNSSNDDERIKGSLIFKNQSSEYGVGDLLFCLEGTANNTNVTSANEKMRIQSDGNVGIGTTAPAGKLHVIDSYAGERNIFLDNPNASGVMQLNIRAGTGNEYLSLLRTTTSASLLVATDPFYIKHYHSGAWHNSIVVAADGKIGIGTASPTTSTELYHASTTDPTLLQITNFSAGDAFINFIERDATGNTNGTKFGEANAWGFQVGYDGGDNKFFIKSGNQETVTTRLAIERDTGNVGIGTVSPGLPLEVKTSGSASNQYALSLTNPNNQAGDGGGAGIRFSTSGGPGAAGNAS